MEEAYRIPKAELSGYEPDFFRPGAGFTLPELQNFVYFEVGQCLFGSKYSDLFGPRGEKIYSFHLTDRFAKKDGTPVKAMDVLLYLGNRQLRDETRVRPWLLIIDEDEHIRVEGGPLILTPEEMIFEDEHACDGFWTPYPMQYVDDIAKQLPGVQMKKYALSKEYQEEDSYFKAKKDFETRYALKDIRDLISVRDQAEQALLRIIQADPKARTEAVSVFKLPKRAPTVFM